MPEQATAPCCHSCNRGWARNPKEHQSVWFTGAAAQVEVVQPPSAGAVAYAMLSIGTTSSDFYRVFISGTTLVAEKKIAGVKTTVSIPYDAAAHRFLRIRHDAGTGQVLWERAPAPTAPAASFVTPQPEARVFGHWWADLGADGAR